MKSLHDDDMQELDGDGAFMALDSKGCFRPSSTGVPDDQTTAKIPLVIFEKLFPYQKAGVQFLAQLHGQHIGGILGDDMGMVGASALWCELHHQISSCAIQ
jgi:hypothetical protein